MNEWGREKVFNPEEWRGKNNKLFEAKQKKEREEEKQQKW
jgi:hypothetical protein